MKIIGQFSIPFKLFSHIILSSFFAFSIIYHRMHTYISQDFIFQLNLHLTWTKYCRWRDKSPRPAQVDQPLHRLSSSQSMQNEETYRFIHYHPFLTLQHTVIKIWTLLSLQYPFRAFTAYLAIIYFGYTYHLFYTRFKMILDPFSDLFRHF